MKMKGYLPTTFYKQSYILYGDALAHGPDFEETLKLLRAGVFSRPYDFRMGLYECTARNLCLQVQDNDLYTLAKLSAYAYDGTSHSPEYFGKVLKSLYIDGCLARAAGRKTLQELHAMRLAMQPHKTSHYYNHTKEDEIYLSLFKNKGPTAPLTESLHPKWHKELVAFYDSLASCIFAQEVLKVLYPLEFST